MPPVVTLTRATPSYFAAPAETVAEVVRDPETLHCYATEMQDSDFTFNPSMEQHGAGAILSAQSIREVDRSGESRNPGFLREPFRIAHDVRVERDDPTSDFSGQLQGTVTEMEGGLRFGIGYGFLPTSVRNASGQDVAVAKINAKWRDVPADECHENVEIPEQCQQYFPQCTELNSAQEMNTSMMSQWRRDDGQADILALATQRAEQAFLGCVEQNAHALFLEEHPEAALCLTEDRLGTVQAQLDAATEKLEVATQRVEQQRAAYNSQYAGLLLARLNRGFLQRNVDWLIENGQALQRRKPLLLRAHRSLSWEQHDHLKNLKRDLARAHSEVRNVSTTVINREGELAKVQQELTRLRQAVG